MDMSVDFLKNVAAGIVAGFKADGVSLNDGIIKAAEVNELNADQTARLVETVNQLAYLSGPHISMDKTAEFPLADYKTIIDHFVNPPIEKAASERRPSPMELIREPMTKKASAPEAMNPREVEAELERRFHQGRSRLENLGIESYSIREGLLKAAAMVKRDPDALQKIAALTGGNATQYNELCNLVFGHVKQARAAIRPAEALVSVRYLQDQLGMAKQASMEAETISEELDKIATILAPRRGMTKEAFLGAVLKGIGGVLKAAPRVAAGGKSGVATAKKGLKLGGMALMAGPEVSQISSYSAPKSDVWSSLHN